MATILGDAMNSTSLSIFLTYVDSCLGTKHYGVVFSFTLMSLCFLVATPANVWCLWSRLRSRPKPAPVLFLNLTLMELVFCVQCPMEMTNDLFHRNVDFLRAVCFVYGISAVGRPLLQACVCVERYVAVVHPLTFLRLRGMRCRVCAAAACWSMGAGYGLYLAYNTNMFPDVIFISVFFVAVSVISFCCASVLCALRSPGPGDRHTGGDQGGTDAGGNLQKRNAFNMIFRVLMVTLLTYLPQVLLIAPIMKVSLVLYYCDFVPLTTFLYSLGVIITPLFTMHDDGHLKGLAQCRRF